jgi:hypothetical protein
MNIFKHKASPEIASLSNNNRLESEKLRFAIGQSLSMRVKQHGVYQNIHESEFRIYSQFGDDGILQYLIHQTKPECEIFIEFGVQNYTEANTRFLLLNNNWKGLIIDGDGQAMAALRDDEIYWRQDLTAIGAFVTRENINQLFTENGFTGEIGLLSIDIDGNDYWVWEAIDTVNPTVVVVEYNSVFGPERAITIPYDPQFMRTQAHYSNLYWGCSLKALCLLAERKGYSFVGCNSNGNNAHFVRKDKVGKIPALSCKEGYVESRFRESRDIHGNLTFLRGKQRIEAIKGMQVVDVEQGLTAQIKDII